MGKSQRLRLNDLRRISGLVGELTDRGRDAVRWRTHALVGFNRLLNAQVGITLDSTNALPGQVPNLIEPITLGWSTPSDARFFYDYFHHDVIDDPGARAMVTGHLAGRFRTGYRRQWIDDRTWYSSPAVCEARRGAGVDDYVSSSVRLATGVLQGFTAYRAIGDRPFEDRHRKLMRLCHAEIFRHYRDGLSHRAMFAKVEQLAPRVRQTLNEVLDGHDLQTVGRRMGLSRHTVNDYTKKIYAHFAVHTRAELMHLFVTPPQAPVLAIPATMPPLGVAPLLRKKI